MQEPIAAACAAQADVASFHALGESEEGRPVYGVVLGTGPRAVSLIAGAHADEPVGPETLRLFILEGLRRRDSLADLFERYRFVIVPHINPDGEARNRAWITRWPSLEAYLERVVREVPGRDLEFGFPAMRPENRLVSEFLRRHAPYSLHMSLHGMGFSEGALLLIERHWAGRTQHLRDRFVAAVHAAGLGLHDHNRKGEKGFFYIEPGFTTTPEGAAMRTYFNARGEEVTARFFHDSSMEFVRSLGGDPLCLVTELPLFLVAGQQPHEAGQPRTYLAFKERLPELKLRIRRGASVAHLLRDFEIRPLDLRTAVRLQLHALALGLEAIST
ncbi:MAG: M14 family zinc carboxypeptidase [Rhodothermales bacterium]